MGKLRLLLALSVVATHGGVIWKFQLVDGPVAVQAFFIISGFYMSLILNEKYVGEFNSFRLFIRNRLWRLFPVYWTVLFGTILLAFVYILMKNDGSLSIFQFYKDAHPSIFTWILLILANLVIIGQDILMFTGIGNNGALYFTSTTPDVPMTAFLVVPQAWTISIELFFYLIAPFVVRKNWKFVGGLMLFSLLIRIFLFYIEGFKVDPWTYRFFPSEIFFFLAGYFSYRFFVRIRNRRDEWIKYSLPVSVIVMSTVFGYSFIPEPAVISTIFSIKQLVFLTIVVLSIPILFLAQRDQPVDRLLGELSYPVYLVHIAVIMLVSGLGLFQPFPWVVVPTTLAISFALHKLVMAPLEIIRQKPFRKF